MAKLIITFKDKTLQEVELSKSITVGREVGDILIKNPSVSARHLKIEKNGNIYTLTDLNSTNGTFVNDERVTSKELKSGDMITVGRHVLKFDNPEESKEETFDLGFDQDVGGRTMMMDPSKLRAITQPQTGSVDVTQKIDPSRKESAKLFMMQASGAPKVIKLDRGSTIIGSSDTADIQIKGLTVGKIAAVISKVDDQYEITYQSGFARLKINGKQEDKRILVNGDKFSIGSYNFEFRTEL
ncbi:MAG: FHA domain-containing protein [Nitrospinae bacterium]|nr:FHA domain-containing protein [Nitrospinota bacterium]